MATRGGLYLALLLLAVWSTSTSGAVYPRGNAKWDFLTFTQIWPSTFCSFETCTQYPGNDTDWNIHGLWPSVYTGKDPEFCPDASTFDVNKVLPIYGRLQSGWMNLKNFANPKPFWSHEWDAHGRCAVTDQQLMDELIYFNATLVLKEAIRLRQRLNNFGIVPQAGVAIQSSTLLNALRTLYRTNAEITCLKHHDGGYYLYEIRLCLDPQMSLIDCPQKGPHNLLGGNVRASSVHCGDEVLYEPKPTTVRHFF